MIQFTSCPRGTGVVPTSVAGQDSKPFTHRLVACRDVLRRHKAPVATSVPSKKTGRGLRMAIQKLERSGRRIGTLQGK